MPNYSTHTPQQSWADEITSTAPMPSSEGQMATESRLTPSSTSAAVPRMNHDLPAEIVESPTDLNEAFLGSLKATLIRNKGNFIVATFLIGTQSTMSWEGILYEVGNDYVTIYQPGRDRYVVIDMYSLKYMEFYDTRRRALCDELLARQGYATRPAMDCSAMSMADNSNKSGYFSQK